MGEIGSHLHIKYDGAVKVQKDSTTNQLVPERANQDLNVTKGLVFSADLPDFCSLNLQSGILGTRQRRRKMFLIRGAGVLDVLRKAQMCGRSPHWLGGPGACSPGKFLKN